MESVQYLASSRGSDTKGFTDRLCGVVSGELLGDVIVCGAGADGAIRSDYSETYMTWVSSFTGRSAGSLQDESVRFIIQVMWLAFCCREPYAYRMVSCCRRPSWQNKQSSHSHQSWMMRLVCWCLCWKQSRWCLCWKKSRW